MIMILRRMRGVAIVAVAAMMAVMAAIGAGVFLRPQGEPRKESVAPRRRDDPVQATKPTSPPLVGVVREADGRPVVGAVLVAGHTIEEPYHRIGTTGSDGRCELTPAGRASQLRYVVAYKEGFAPASAFRFENRGDPGETELRLLPPVPFVGEVRDGAGKPVAGAVVQVVEASFRGIGDKDTQLWVLEWVVRGTPLERVFRSTTDTRGRFRFPALPKCTCVHITVTATGIGEYERDHSIWPGRGIGQRGTVEAPAQVVLKPVTRVVGRVVTRLPGVKVDGLKLVLNGAESYGPFHHRRSSFPFNTSPKIAETRTDEQGRFEFDSLVGERADIFLGDYRAPGRGPIGPSST